MYKEVKTEEEKGIALQLHKEIYGEEELLVEELRDEGVHYLFYDGDKPIGLIELTPYNPMAYLSIEYYFPFSQLEQISLEQGQIWEIDKVGILSSTRGRRILHEIEALLSEFSIINNVNTYVALIESRLFKVVNFLFSEHEIKKVGPKFLVPGESKSVIPTILTYCKKNSVKEPIS